MKSVIGIGLISIILCIACGPKTQKVLPAADQYHMAKDYYDKGKYLKAQIAFENLIYTYPGNSVIDSAQFYLAMCYYNQDDYAIAAGEYKRLIASYRQSQFADDAQFYIGMCHYNMSPKYQLDQSETVLAIEEFKNLINAYPGSPLIADARIKMSELEDKLSHKKYSAGRMYLKFREYDPALLYFSFVRDNYPSTTWAIEAYFYSGVAYLKKGEYDEARQIFENFKTAFGDHKLAAEANKRLAEIEELSSPKVEDGS